MASNINAMPAGEDEPLLQPKRKSMKSIVVTSLAVSLVLGACAATAIHSRNDVKVASLAKTIDGKSCLYYYQEEGDACTDPDDFDGMVCANDGDYDEMYCSFDIKNKKKACVRCQQYDKESKSYMIKGRKCKKKHVINDSLGDAKEITECEDPDDYEGMVCANDGATTRCTAASTWARTHARAARIMRTRRSATGRSIAAATVRARSALSATSIATTVLTATPVAGPVRRAMMSTSPSWNSRAMLEVCRAPAWSTATRAAPRSTIRAAPSPRPRRADVRAESDRRERAVPRHRAACAALLCT